VEIREVLTNSYIGSRRILRPDSSSPEDSLLEKNSPETEDSSPDISSLGKFFVRIIRRIYRSNNNLQKKIQRNLES
jgi:hypothetical protein